MDRIKTKKFDKVKMPLKIAHSRSHIYGEKEFETVGEFRKEYEDAKAKGLPINCYRYMADTWYAISDKYVQELFKGRVI